MTMLTFQLDGWGSCRPTRTVRRARRRNRQFQGAAADCLWSAPRSRRQFVLLPWIELETTFCSCLNTFIFIECFANVTILIKIAYTVPPLQPPIFWDRRGAAAADELLTDAL